MSITSVSSSLWLINFLPVGHQRDSITLVGLAGPANNLLGTEAQNNYDKAIEDFRKVINDFPGTKERQEDTETLGERAFVQDVFIFLISVLIISLLLERLS